MITNFTFGKASVNVLSHETREQGLTHHQAEIQVFGHINKVFMQNEVIDLISLHVNYDPIICKIHGSRVVIEKGWGHFEVHWNTESGIK